MLPKSQRLNLKTGFKFVAAGKKAQSQSFRLMYRLGENPQALVGVALTKKEFKGSVERNRAKRLVSTAIQPLYPSLRKGLNLVIMPNSQILKNSVEKIQKELDGIKDLYQSN
jgi:ribonuclease P protein component